MKTQSALVLILFFALFSLTLEKKIKSSSVTKQAREMTNAPFCACKFVFNKGTNIEFEELTWWANNGKCNFDGCSPDWGNSSIGNMEYAKEVVGQLKDNNNREYFYLKSLTRKPAWLKK